MRLLHAHARNEMLYCAPTGVQMFRCIPQLTAACLVSTSIGKHLGSRCPGLRWNGVHLGFVSLPVAAFTGSGYKFLFSFALFYKWGELAPGMCFFFFFSWSIQGPSSFIFCTYLFSGTRTPLFLHSFSSFVWGSPSLPLFYFISIRSVYMQRLMLHLACLMLRMGMHYTHAVYHVMNGEDAATLRTACAYNCRCYASHKLDLSSDGRGESWQPEAPATFHGSHFFSFWLLRC